MEKQEHVDVII